MTRDTSLTQRRPIMRLTSLLVGAAAAVVLAACGGDATAPPPDAPAASDGASTEPSQRTEPSEGTEPSEPSDPSGPASEDAEPPVVPSGDRDSQFCDVARGFDQQFDEQQQIDFRDPVAVERYYTDLLGAIGSIVAIAPPELVEDAQVAFEDFSRQVAALEAADWDTRAELDYSPDPRGVAANDAVTVYLEETCGIE